MPRLNLVILLYLLIFLLTRSMTPMAQRAVQRIRVAGDVLERNLVTRIDPVYPPLAKSARIQGSVILDFTVSKEGNVKDISVESGHPLLIQSALEALRKWKYRPTTLNGNIVEVISRITFKFALPAEPATLVRQGYTLKPEEATRLEEKLKESPEDMETRTLLLGYYFSAARQAIGTPATLEARRRHILWIIENHPEAEIAGMSEAAMDPSGQLLADKEGYKRAKNLWLKQVQKKGDSVDVIKHAAFFFKTPDMELSATILQKGLSWHPDDQGMAVDLGYQYALAILGARGVNQTGIPQGVDPHRSNGPFAKKARMELENTSNESLLERTISNLLMYGSILRATDTLGNFQVDFLTIAECILMKVEERNPKSPTVIALLEKLKSERARLNPSTEVLSMRARYMMVDLEKSLNTTSDPLQRFGMLSIAAQASLMAGELEKAKKYAQEAIQLAPEMGNAPTSHILNSTHLVLGRVALKLGDIEEAEQELIKAGHLLHEVSADNSSPGMALAKELLEKGRRDVVIHYFDLCAKFWEPGRQALAKWKSTVQAGGIPKFPFALLREISDFQGSYFFL